VLLGGLLQVIIQLPPLFRFGFGRIFKTKLNYLQPGVKQIAKLHTPRIFGSAIYQFNVLVDTIIASLAHIVGEGAVSAIYYANRIIQFPLAVFGIALSTALLPNLSHQAARDNYTGLKSTLSLSLKMICFIILPISLCIAVLSRPLIKVLFERGEFGVYSTSITSWALLFYAFGLIAFAGVKIIISCFYSLQDTVTPVRTAFLSLLVNIILNLVLMFPLKVGGLALASSLSASLNFFLLYSILDRRIGRILQADFGRFILKVTLSALLAAISCYLAGKILFTRLSPFFALGVVIFVSTFTYLVSCFCLRVKEVYSFIKWLPQKIGR
jgi:putative peptidoglycan lipid II flippase